MVFSPAVGLLPDRRARLYLMRVSLYWLILIHPVLTQAQVKGQAPSSAGRMGVLLPKTRGVSPLDLVHRLDVGPLVW